MDPLRQQMLTMASLSGLHTQSGQTAQPAQLWIYMIQSMLMVALIERLFQALPKITEHFTHLIQKFVQRRAHLVGQGAGGLLPTPPTSSIQLERIYKSDKTSGNASTGVGNVASQGTDNDMFDGLLHHLSALPECRFLRRTNTGILIVDHQDPIPLGDEFWARMLETRFDEDGNIERMQILFYSPIHHLNRLHKQLHEYEKKYALYKQNKFGDQLFYFNEHVQYLPRMHDGSLNYATATRNLVFSMSPFHTFKRMENMYGIAMERVRRRVAFFRENRVWYERKGVPYTLGLLLYGPPGCGKTSLIKAIANECHRHVFNVHLSEHMTNTQITNLFFQDRVHVVEEGQTCAYTIPMQQRLLVFEDIDCMSSVVYQRKDNTEAPAPAPAPAHAPAPADELIGGMMSMSTIFTEQAGTDIHTHPRTKSAKTIDYNPHGDKNRGEQLTLSTLLNLLDGVLETPGRIVIMTSNHPDKLDKALVRPGRIDLIVNFDTCTVSEVQEIVEGITDTAYSADTFATIPDKQWTPAQVSQKVFEHFGHPDKAIQALHKQQ